MGGFLGGDSASVLNQRSSTLTKIRMVVYGGDQGLDLPNPACTTK